MIQFETYIKDQPSIEAVQVTTINVFDIAKLIGADTMEVCCLQQAEQLVWFYKSDGKVLVSVQLKDYIVKDGDRYSTMSYIGFHNTWSAVE